MDTNASAQTGVNVEASSLTAVFPPLFSLLAALGFPRPDALEQLKTLRINLEIHLLAHKGSVTRADP